MVPLCLDALTARLLHELGFPAGYVSGGALGFSHAVSEALLTLSEIVDTTRHITARSALPIVVDGGVGFGDAVHVARTIWEVEASGAVAIEIEDQVAPKRVSHHRGIEHLISCDAMIAKIEQAVSARQDSGFLIIARTGAVRNESFAAAVDRANAYADAGADVIMLMPQQQDEWRQAPQSITAPLAAITSLDARTADEWRELGWSLIIDPFTAQAACIDLLRKMYGSFAETGSTGMPRNEIMASYRALQQYAGLNELYRIEDETTEKAT
jgi:methylisocitrate lyase|tara:strand:+ start:3803 stop:4609 length:807 start_codon:yes stop_codon:yes gene_type:complete